MGLTRYKTAKGQRSLSNEVSPNRVMIPNKKSNQSYFRHVDGKGERFLPNRIKPYNTNGAKSFRNTVRASTGLNFHEPQQEAGETNRPNMQWTLTYTLLIYVYDLSISITEIIESEKSIS